MNGWSKWIKKYFIPHEENEYKPHLLRQRSVMIFLLIVFIIEIGFLAQIFIIFDKTKFLAAVLPGVLTTLTNEERKASNAPPLVPNDLLAKAATLKAEDMAINGYFAHTSPNGITPWYWFEKVGYRYSRAGENLAVNFFDSEDVARAWMNSPTHRANIVKADYTEIGIGIANGKYKGKNTVFVAQLFGTPIKIAPLTETPTPKPTTPAKPISIPDKETSPPEVVTPPTVVAITSPVVTQILGEEADSIPVIKNPSTISNIKSFIQKTVTSPRHNATYVYGIILILIILALLLAIFIKIETQHPQLIGRGVALVVIIISLLYVNIKILDFNVEVPNDTITANAISTFAN